ncbi:MAG: FAD-dependent oxidoreductase [Actinobacteria bacterium]|nr:FAD-dependent oxidoreductase [Actinomycetota bacterium]
MRYVVVGTGVAAISAAEAIRSRDEDGDLTLVGADPHGFYSRPGLAYYLHGEIPERQLFWQADRRLPPLGIRHVRDVATGIRPDDRSITLAGGDTLGYDRLLLAVGAQSVPLDVPGAGLDGVMKLDDLDDARRIVKAAKRGRPAVVVGGGVTALELVEGLTAQGMRVHFLLRGERYWGSVLDEEESRIVLQGQRDAGVTVHHDARVEEIVGKRGRVSGVRTTDGRTIPAALVAYAIGIRPRLELARSAGLDVDRGILVDERLQTSATDVYAAGDVAQVFDPSTGTSVLDSLWNPARQQGRVAGLNMAGAPTVYTKQAPINVTRLAGLTTTIIGTVGAGRDGDLVGIARGDSETWRTLPDAIAAQNGFETNRLRLMVGADRILGAIVMGDQTLSAPLQTLIERGADIGPIRSRLLAPGAPIADIVIEFWTEWGRAHAAQQP